MKTSVPSELSPTTQMSNRVLAQAFLSIGSTLSSLQSIADLSESEAYHFEVLLALV